MSRPRLRPPIRTVRVGKDTLVFLGGPAILRSTGPAVARLFVPLLDMLDGRRSLASIVRGWSGAEREKAMRFLADLEASGLIEDGREPAPAPTHPTANFIGRFASLADAGSGAAMSADRLADTVLVIRDIPRRAERLAEILLESGLSARIEAGAPPRGGRRAFASLIVPCASGPFEAQLTRSRTPGEVELSLVAAPESKPDGEELVTAIVAHWALMACAGMPVVRALDRDGGLGPDLENAEPETGLPMSAAAAPAAAGMAEGLQALAEIARFAVGRGPGDRARHIAPTAGNLRSAHLLCLIPRPGRDDPVSACFFDGESGTFDMVGDISRAALEAALGQTGDGPWLLFAAVTARLRARYGEIAERLAHYDGGMAMDHAVRAARAFACAALRRPAAPGEQLLELIGLSGGGQLIVTGLLELPGLAPGRGTRRPAPDALARAALDAMPERRSVRRFSGSRPTAGQIRSVEAALNGERYAAEPWRQPSSPLRLYRLTKTARGTFTMVRVALRGRRGSRAVASIEDEFFAESLIGQPDLATAPLFYLIGRQALGNDRERPRDPCPDRQRWVDEGMLCSALWIEAHSRGLMGAPYGDADVDRLILEPQISLGRLCLCLGLPTGEDGKASHVIG